MPLSALALRPGIVKDETVLASEGGYADGNRVRFRNARPETIGGWAPRTSTKFIGSCRGAHDWVDLRGQRLLAWGTDSNLYALYGGAVLDITPAAQEGVLRGPYASAAGLSVTSGSNVVTVKHAGHGMATGETIIFTNASPVGGVTLAGSYVISRISDDSYTVSAAGNATSTASYGANDTIDYSIPLPPGNQNGTVSGYSNGPYGLGVYGGSAAGDPFPRVWSMDNMGQNLVANPRGKGIYEWRPVQAPPEIVKDGGFDTTQSWTNGVGFIVTGGVAAASSGSNPGTITNAVTDQIVEGAMYRLTVSVVATGTGGVRMQVLTDPVASTYVDAGEASIPITRTGTYSRLFRAPVGAKAIAFTKDGTFTGSIDNVSVRLESKAYRVKGAPANVDWMFVDPNRIVVALATRGFGGDYDPLLARWSDMEDIEDWTPTTTNVSGELPVAGGAKLMTGMVVRGGNLLLSDIGAFQFQFTGTTQGFTQRPIGTGCGVIGRNAAVEWNGTAYWMSVNGFFAYSGGPPQKIPCPCERYVLNNLDELQHEKIYAGVNPRFNEIWWLYPDIRDGDECSRAIVYNYAEQTWSTHIMDRTCWVASGLFENPIAFSPDGYVFEHEVGTDANGQPLNWWLETSAMDIEDGDTMTDCFGLVPDVFEQMGEVTYEIWFKLYPNGPDLPRDARVTTSATQVIRFRREGRQVRLRISSMAVQSKWRAGAIKLDLLKLAAKA